MEQQSQPRRGRQARTGRTGRTRGTLSARDIGAKGTDFQRYVLNLKKALSIENQLSADAKDKLSHIARETVKNLTEAAVSLATFKGNKSILASAVDVAAQNGSVFDKKFGAEAVSAAVTAGEKFKSWKAHHMHTIDVEVNVYAKGKDGKRLKDAAGNFIVTREQGQRSVRREVFPPGTSEAERMAIIAARGPNYRAPRVTAQQKAELVFPPARVRHLIDNSKGSLKVASEATLHVTAIVQYLIAAILKNAQMLVAGTNTKSVGRITGDTINTVLNVNPQLGASVPAGVATAITVSALGLKKAKASSGAVSATGAARAARRGRRASPARQASPRAASRQASPVRVASRQGSPAARLSQAAQQLSNAAVGDAFAAEQEALAAQNLRAASQSLRGSGSARGSNRGSGQYSNLAPLPAYDNLNF